MGAGGVLAVAFSSGFNSIVIQTPTLEGATIGAGPPLDSTITITGEVRFPGDYPIKRGETLRSVFGKYVAMLSRMNLITGSLSLLMFVLISVFLVWVLILLGVELTHVLQTKMGKGRRRRHVPAGRAENAIRMLLRMAEGGIHRFRDLYHDQEGSSVDAERILECLRDAKLVDGDGARGFALAEPAEKITVAKVVEAISPNLYTIDPQEEDRVAQVLQPLFARLDSERRALLNATIADLRK